MVRTMPGYLKEITSLTNKARQQGQENPNNIMDQPQEPPAEQEVETEMEPMEPAGPTGVAGTGLTTSHHRKSPPDHAASLTISLTIA